MKLFSIIRIIFEIVGVSFITNGLVNDESVGEIALMLVLEYASVNKRSWMALSELHKIS